MALTDEQHAAIQAPESRFKINAVAGSGKTTTLLEYAKRRADKRILYLAYNRAIAREIAQKLKSEGLKHVTASTIHSLAYRHVGGNTFSLEAELSEGFIADRYLSDDPRNKRLLTAWLIKDLTGYYLNAAYTRLDDGLLERYEDDTTPKGEVRSLLDNQGMRLLAVVKAVLGDMRQKRIPAVHDFYLKLFQFSKPRLLYDIILVDEAQDTSGVMLSILQRQSAGQVYVGDTFQQIYAFRFAINSLARLELPVYPLTQTFRFGDFLARTIAQRVNAAYALLKLSDRLIMKGTEDYTKVGLKALDGRSPIAVIGRSNLELFKACLEYLHGTKARFHFEGAYSGYSFMNQRVASVYYLSIGQAARIHDALIKRFTSLDELERFANETQNQRLLTIIELVETYGGDLFDFDKEIKSRLEEKQNADIVFTTTHKAKGQEYQHVKMLADDFITQNVIRELLKKEKSDVPKQRLREEINVYYVAATRASSAISLAAF